MKSAASLLTALFLLGGSAPAPSDLNSAVDSGNHEAAGKAAKAAIAGGAGAKELCLAIRKCGDAYDKHLNTYRNQLAMLQKIHIASEAQGKDPGKVGHPQFDKIFPVWIDASLGLENAERCALAIAEAFKGVASEEALLAVSRVCKTSGRLKLADYLVEALANMRHPGVTAELLNVLESRAGWRMKVAAIDGLGKRLTPETRTAIAEYINSSDGRLRRAAMAALNKQPATPREGKGGATFYGTRVGSEAPIFVVDVSDSMHREDAKSRSGGTKARFTVLKEELTAVVKDLPDGTNMNVVGFNSLAWVLAKDMIPLTEKTRPTLNEAIKKMGMALQTQTGDGLQVAFLLANGDLTGSNDVITGGDRRAVDTLFLMTDGRPASGKRLPDNIKKLKTNTNLIISRVKLWNRRHRLVINTIGIGDAKGGDKGKDQGKNKGKNKGKGDAQAKGNWLARLAKEHQGTYISH
jgi:hypothetical protein